MTDRSDFSEDEEDEEAMAGQKCNAEPTCIYGFCILALYLLSIDQQTREYTQIITLGILSGLLIC